MSNSTTLKWRFDVNAFRLLGRELITDRVTAIVELVKNAYDANATEVEIEFQDVFSKNENGSIIIRDNGIGMTFEDIQNKWMVVGTASKRTQKQSLPPFNRTYIGEKGIGRFAVDKLGGHLTLITKSEASPQEVQVEINWKDYEEQSEQAGEQLKLFTEVENRAKVVDKLNANHGTTLVIKKIHEIWTKDDIEKVYLDLSRLVSPFRIVNPPFKMFIIANQHPKFFSKTPISPDLNSFDAELFSLDFDMQNETQQTLHFDKKSGTLSVVDKPKKSFGLIAMKICYFNEAAKNKFNNIYKGKNVKIDGIKVYRDGVLATPFAEQEVNSYKQRDVLGIDKRLWQSTYDRIGTREIIGWVDISKERNPQIIDATNRQDFVQTEEFRAFKDFIIHQLDQIGNLKVDRRQKTKKKADDNLEKVKLEVQQAVDELKEMSRNVKKNNPLIAPVVESLTLKTSRVNEAVKTISKVNKELEAENKRKENLYLSLMSLQAYAANLAHAVRTALGKIKRSAEFLKNRFPDPLLEEIFIKHSRKIYDEIDRLGKVVDFMLSYAQATLDTEEFSPKLVLNELFDGAYKMVFEAEGINASVEIKDDIDLVGNKKFFENIFEELISNSIKALEGKKDKIIKCSGWVENNDFVCLFSDNGIGVKPGDENKVFEIYYTTTADKGGAGLGLFRVEKRVQAFRGQISLIESEFQTGATFKLVLPFKNKTP